MNIEFATIEWGGRRISVEHAWIERHQTNKPLFVFLHEGLGSLAMWKSFPTRLCQSVGARGLVYSRPGYGRSTPRASDEAWGVDFMHAQAQVVLPALFEAVKLDTTRDKPWLLGHSDGGSIALLYAASYPQMTAGTIVLAPHIMVEEISLHSIQQTRTAYLQTNLRSRLAAYHDNPDSAYFGWSDIWLDPAFRAWTIEPLLGNIACPVLAIQGHDDPYGTMAQITGIAQHVPQTQLLALPGCGHSPHVDKPDEVIAAVVAFLGSHHSDQPAPWGPV